MDQINSVAIKHAKRCFLFAAYYKNNTIDSFDVYHLKKLSELGDVFFFTDADDFPQSELDRIRPYVRMTGFEAHGEYDFGSWKRLISLIGLDRLSQYEEIITLNNSSILVGNLSVFLKSFEASPAKFGSILLLDEHYDGPIIHLQDYLVHHDVQTSSAMFPSAFWLFKRELFLQPFVQRFFDSIKPEANRLEVCYRYEREFSRSIFRHAIEYKVFIDTIFKYASIYTADAFRLIDMGLPYIKKKVFMQVYYSIDHLNTRVQRLIKNAPREIAPMLQQHFIQT